MMFGGAPSPLTLPYYAPSMDAVRAGPTPAGQGRVRPAFVCCAGNVIARCTVQGLSVKWVMSVGRGWTWADAAQEGKPPAGRLRVLVKRHYGRPAA